MKNILTKRQKELLLIIYQYIKNSGYPPTLEEMKNELDVVSNQSVLDFLEKLKDKKLIEKKEGIARGIRISGLGYRVLDKMPLVAMAGTTSAGSPVEAIETIGEWQTVSDGVARLKEEVFLLKISGDSMINAGINDGDVVLVKSEKEFRSGDIVLAQINDESTVKRFISDNKPPFIYLKPENPDYKVIPFTEEMKLTGKVISVLKNDNWQPIK